MRSCLRSSSPNQNNYNSTFTSSSSLSDFVKKSLDEHDYEVAASQTVVLYNVKEGILDIATDNELHTNFPYYCGQLFQT